MRCFGERVDGFYIDVGSGHPVYDNVSFAFYLKGWRGITVEPNPWLARLSRAVRPRDRHVEALIGAAAGDAKFYLVQDFHGLSTMIESHAQSALGEFGARTRHRHGVAHDIARALRRRRPGHVRFPQGRRFALSGGAAQRRLAARWRPFGSWWWRKPALGDAGARLGRLFAGQARHRYVWSTALNRRHLRRGSGELATAFATAPAVPGGLSDAVQFMMWPAAWSDAHPDHALAALPAWPSAKRLPVLDRRLLLEHRRLERGRGRQACRGTTWSCPRPGVRGARPLLADLTCAGRRQTVRGVYAAVAETDSVSDRVRPDAGYAVSPRLRLYGGAPQPLAIRPGCL